MKYIFEGLSVEELDHILEILKDYEVNLTEHVLFTTGENKSWFEKHKEFHKSVMKKGKIDYGH